MPIDTPALQCGHFDDAAREYVITEPRTPRPWHTYLCNEVYLANITQVGTGACFYQPKGEGLRANLVEDRDGGGGPRYVWLRDRETGAAWSLTGAGDGGHELAAWRCRVGLGYQVMESERDGVAASWRVAVPPGDDRCELWTVTVTNRDRRSRWLSVVPCLEMHLTGGSTLMDFVAVLGGFYQPADRAVYGINNCLAFPGYFKGVLASSRTVAAATVSREEFLGHHRDWRLPQALERGDVDNPQAGTEWLAPSLRHEVDLAPGESWRVDLVVGIIDDPADGRRLIDRYLAAGAVDEVNADLARRATARSTRNAVATGDPQADRWISIWLKRQLEVVADWGRVIGRGYRDMLQDCFAHRLTEPDKARERILETFSKQYADGRCIRAWRLPNAQLDTQDYADSPSWMAPALCLYLKETADWSILDEPVPFLADDPAAASTESASAWEHVLRGQRHLLADRGRHGLCRIRHGDWCDTMNGVGRGGEGVSVMLSQQVVWGCRMLAELADIRGLTDLAGEMRQGAEELTTSIQTTGWDGGWYRRAFDDDGIVVGGLGIPAEEGGEQVIFLNPQAWALITGMADNERAESAIAAVEERLDIGYGKALNAPQSTRLKPRIGQMSAMTPGFYENGSVYTHGNCFWAAGLALSGRADAAWEALRTVLPDTDNKPNGDSEPYTMPNMYIGPVVERRKQRSLYLSGWRTGSAAWTYLICVEYLLGLQADYAGLRLAPALPAAWADARAVRDFRGARYEVQFHGHGNRVTAITVDGEPIEGHVLPLAAAGTTVTVTVTLATRD